MASTISIVDLPAPTKPPPRSQKEVAVSSPRDEWTVVRGMALRQLDRIISLEPKVLRGDKPDAIHDMRVASRRLQQVFDLLYPPPAAKEIRKLRRVMKRSRRWLSEVRNCDVLIEQVAARLARKRTAHREVWAAVENYLHERRSESLEKAQRKISKLNMAVFYVHLKGYLKANGAKPDSTAHNLEAGSEQLVPHEFYERIGQAVEDGWQAFEDQVADSRRDPQAPLIHRARIATKKLRYLIEVIREFSVPGTGELLAWLRKVQRHLGEWHDLEVLEQMMIDMVARQEFLRDHLEIAMGVEKLILRTRKTKKGLEGKYFLMTIDSREFQQMKEWVAYLLSSPSAAFANA